MKSLPFIDRHCVVSEASPADTWNGLVRMLASRLRGSGRVARVLGCEPAEGTARFRGRSGDAVPGFRVAVSEPGHRLVLRGRHRFALYQLTFLLDAERLCAETHAEFPGLKGRIYRTAVIGSGGHTLVTRWMLRRVVRANREERLEAAAEKRNPPGEHSSEERMAGSVD